MNTRDDTPETLYQKGLSLWQQGKANDAFQYFQQALAQSDKRPHFLLAITGLLMESGHLSQAVEVLRQYSVDTRASSELQLRLALLHMKLEQTAAAVDILKTCVAQNPNLVDAYTMLAENYGHLNDPDSAVDTLNALLRQYPRDISIHNSAASYLSAIGAQSAALEAYRLGLEQEHCDAETLSKVARIHFSLGDFDKASNFNLQAINKDVNSAAAYLGIATSKSFSPDDGKLIQQFTDTLGLNINREATTALHFSLGKIHDDLGSYDRAFEYYKNGNETHRSSMTPPFDLEAVGQHFVAQKHFFTHERLGQLQRNNRCNSQPIFILGMPRSGTTLVERIFSNDQNVFIAGEMETLDLMPGHMQSSTENRLSYPEILHHLPPEAMSYYQQQYLASATPDHERYRHILDKNPLNFVNIGLIKTLFPRAYIIHCKRGALDNCLSLYFQYFAHNKMDFSYDLDTLAQYYLLYLDMMQHWQAQGVELLTIHYETLVGDPQTTIKSLGEYTGLDHLGLKAGDAMAGPIHTASVWQARQDIHNNSVDRWAHYRAELADYIARYPNLFG